MSQRTQSEIKRGWKIFFGLLVWFAIMSAIWFLWPE
jgi:hypothetical protein